MAEMVAILPILPQVDKKSEFQLHKIDEKLGQCDSMLITVSMGCSRAYKVTDVQGRLHMHACRTDYYNHKFSVYS